MPLTEPDSGDVGMVSEEQLTAAEKIWQYMDMQHTVQKSDVIIALGSNDLRTAEVAADLFLQGQGDWLVMSGKDGNLTKGKWTKTEAEMFCDVALKKGVPSDKIILETEATNSGQNCLFTYKLLQSKNIEPKSMILVQKPYMQRRAYATFKKQWPTEVDIYVTSVSSTLVDYPCKEVGSLSYIISVLIGDLQRIKVYSERGFQIHQDIPEEVWGSGEMLIKSGQFSRHLIS